MGSEQEKNTLFVQDFVQYIRRVKKYNAPNDPIKNLVGITEHPGESYQDAISRLWEEKAKDFLSLEAEETQILTMTLLLKSLRKPKTPESWLSIGSGAGLYEISLAKFFPQVTITSLDASHAFLDMQQIFIKDESSRKRKAKLEERVIPTFGRMEDIGQQKNKFDKILVINSLQWSTDWKATVEQIEQALKLNEGSQALVVTALAGIRRVGDAEVLTHSNDLQIDTLQDQFEQTGLSVKSAGALFITSGQYGNSTARTFGVYERTSSGVTPWKERYAEGKLRMDGYELRGGQVRFGNAANMIRNIPRDK